MILLIDTGKTNQFGKIKYAVVIWHWSPILCVMGHMAFYLFYYWNIVICAGASSLISVTSTVVFVLPPVW
jgi:hypothetical protein